MKKRSYRKISLKSVTVENVLHKLGEHRRLIVAVDVAKTDMVAALADPARPADSHVLLTLAWKHPAEQSMLQELLVGLQRAGVQLQAVMEPSGSYGDALRLMLQQLSIEVYRVSTHRSHGAAQIYDGVASLHDAKSAHILSRLHREGASDLWMLPTPAERALGSAISIMDMYKGERQREINRLEALLSRHWPELLDVMELGSASQLALLSTLGTPQQVASQATVVRELLETTSQGMIRHHTLDAVLASAHRTVGIPMLEAETQALQELCHRALSTLQGLQKAKQRVNKLGQQSDARMLSAVVGTTTAAVLVHEVGSPKAFGSAAAYAKAYGLNLREKSSGKYKGQLKLTKCGPSRARQYLWLAALRWLQHDPIARAYYLSKVRRDGGKKSRAVVSLMRKLVKGLYAMAHSGAAFDPHKLFDTTRLGLTA